MAVPRTLLLASAVDGTVTLTGDPQEVACLAAHVGEHVTVDLPIRFVVKTGPENDPAQFFKRLGRSGTFTRSELDAQDSGTTRNQDGKESSSCESPDVNSKCNDCDDQETE